MITFIMTAENVPALQFNISPPGDVPYLQQQIPQPDYAADPDRCSVRMGPNSVTGDLTTYTIHAEGDGIRGDLVFTGVAPGFRNGPYVPPEDAAAMWLGEQITIPVGTVTGTLVYGGAPHPVRGTCYHDHQWGNDGHTSPVTRWYWGRAGTPELAIVFAQLYAPHGDDLVPVGTLFHYSRGARSMFDSDSAALTIDVVAPTAGEVPLGAVVTWSGALGRIQATLGVPKVIGKFARPGKTAYTRFASPVVIDVDYGGERCSGESPSIWEIQTYL